jgi:hypothetical protein
VTDDEAAALTQELHNIVENDRYPFSPRIRIEGPIPPQKVNGKGYVVGGNPEEPPQAVRVLMRLREYLRVATVQFPILIRPFTRWYFDLLKNALVIAAVSYFAEKTKSKTLHFIAEFSLVLFYLYCFTYLYAWEPWLLNRVKSPIRVLLIRLLILVTVGVIYGVFNHTLHLVMKALRRAQLP